MSILFNQDQHYRAIRSHDPRFEGHFFFAVNSTGIYCRPVCAAKAPKPENCLFFPNATAAEAAGFRPCLRCRPDLISGNASIDAVTCLVQRALSFIEDGFLNDACLNELAKELEITDRHLRRIFQAELGVTPIKFAQTQRLLLAKRLLADTGLPITEIAFAAGFHSLRRFCQWSLKFPPPWSSKMPPPGLKNYLLSDLETNPALSFSLSL